MVGLLDYYHELAKTQHGASKVNLLPWEFYDRVTQLATRLDLMSTDVMATLWKNLYSNTFDLLKIFVDIEKGEACLECLHTKFETKTISILLDEAEVCQSSI